MNDVSSEHATTHHPRVEDDVLVRGAGKFVDDAGMAGKVYAHFVRSPHARARIKAVDIAAAARAPGVIRVLAAADMAGIGNVSRHPPVTGRGGAKLLMPHRPALAGDSVKHVGEPVAAVIAETPQAAQDAAELVRVDYEELPAVVDVRDAVRDGAPQIFPDVPGNVAVDWPGPVPDDGSNARAVDEIIAKAAHVARVSYVQQRIVVASMETRGATAAYDAASDSYTLRACSQGAGPLRELMAPIIGVPKDRLRVLTEDVGGAFGLKTAPYPEYPVLMVAARLIGKPVHWMSSRTESFVSDNHARDAVSDAELALDENGKFLAMRVRYLANLGAYVTPAGVNLATMNFARCFPGMYRIPKIDVSVKCVFTNTVPTGPYRGAGRPEANYLLERLVDEAARITGIDRVKLRRRNLIPRSAMPYKTPVGTTYDSGNFPAVFEKALELCSYDAFKQRRRESKAGGRLRGLGISCFLEHAGAMPTESAALTFPGTETLVLGLGVQSTGQGHATVFPDLIAQRLGIPAGKIMHRHGDSSMELPGFPSVGSRSAITAGAAVVRAVELVLAKGKKVAAAMLEAGEGDIAYEHGAFKVVGTDRRVSLFQVAQHAAELKSRGEIEESLDTKATLDTPQTFPNGCHIAEVEIDPGTGEVKVVAYAAVDDTGNVLNHMIVEGQLHGSVAQGLGQAVLENIAYDSDGQLVTGSFMDYAMPRADDMPPIRDSVFEIPATTNPLGVKGVGEAGTTSAIAAIMNAIADAIPSAAKLDMPATPEKVWKLCREAKV